MDKLLISTHLLTLIFVVLTHSLVSVHNHCALQACHRVDPNAINIHLVPHTHDDVGWTATVNEYYNGEVKFILDTVMEQLIRNSTYRFTYVEMAFFEMWWNEQTPERREQVRQLVSEGQLQFALGGWVSSDEAVVHYSDLIEQLTVGRQFIRQTFGSCVRPHAAWQVDPFGHSSGHAAIFLDAGYDALYFQRLDFREKQFLREHKQLEFLWNVDETELSTRADQQYLFTSVFYRGYCFPSDICFSEDCAYTLMDEADATHEMVQAFLEHLNKWFGAFRFNHILVPMGCDFSFTNAEFTFGRIDTLIEHVNNHVINGTRLHMFYSTPDCYTASINTECQSVDQLPERKGDFLPYEEKPRHYWTGFYTSRPALKFFVRQNALLQTVAEQLSLFVNQSSTENVINALRKQVAVLQHHDAITGTAKEHVTNDYLFKLHYRAVPVQQLVSQMIDKLSKGQLTGLQFCDLRNISVCPVTERMSFMVIVYNPLGWEVSKQQWLRVPVNIPNVSPLDLELDVLNEIDIEILGTSVHPEPETIPGQLIPVSDRTKSIPERLKTGTSANAELLFSPTYGNQYLPALGFIAFHITLIRNNSRSDVETKLRKKSRLPVWLPFRRTWFRLENQGNQVILSVTHLTSGKRFRIAIEMLYYLGSVNEENASGAYVFQPKENTRAFKFYSQKMKKIEGPCVTEFAVHYTSWAEMRVRHYVDDLIEIEWTVGPIPDRGRSISCEVIVRYSTNGARELQPETPGEFFTDSAGRHLVRRLRNQRPEWNEPSLFNDTNTISGNYYPVANRILLRGSPNRNPSMTMAVYTDRPQGGSSLNEGELELMVHRRLVRDDHLGVDEALMENGTDGRGLVVRGHHWLRVDETAAFEAEDRMHAELVNRPPLPLFVESTSERLAQITTLKWSGLVQPLPANIHLLSLMPWPLMSTDDNRQILIRLENLVRPKTILSSGSRINTKPQYVSTDRLLKGIRIIHAVEMIITADVTKVEAARQRMLWPGQQRPKEEELSNVVVLGNSTILLKLNPGTIHTFILNYTTIDQT